MDINKLPNVKKHYIKDGYLTIQLNTGDYIRFNFNNIEALIEQCTISGVVGRSEQLRKRPNTSSTLECFTKSEKQQKGNVKNNEL